MNRALLVSAPATIAALAFAVSTAGTPAGAAPPGSVDQTMPALVYNSHPDVASFLLFWIEDRGTGADVYAKRLFANGLPQGGAERRGWQVMRDDAPAGRYRMRADPAVVVAASLEEYLLVFSQFTDDDRGWEVYGVRVSTAGYARGAPRLLAGGPGDQRHPDVATAPEAAGAAYVVVWEDDARDVDEVWAVKVQANGLPRGAAFPVVRGTSNASDPTTSGSAVAWVDDGRGQADIFAIKLRNALPSGGPTPVTGDLLEEFNPRFSSGGLIWNVFHPMTGVDIMGIEVIESNRTRGGANIILVPAADQMAPDMENGVLVFADNRSGEYDLYAVRVVTAGRVRAVGHDYPVMREGQGSR